MEYVAPSSEKYDCIIFKGKAGALSEFSVHRKLRITDANNHVKGM